MSHLACDALLVTTVTQEAYVALAEFVVLHGTIVALAEFAVLHGTIVVLVKFVVLHGTIVAKTKNGTLLTINGEIPETLFGITYYFKILNRNRIISHLI